MRRIKIMVSVVVVVLGAIVTFCALKDSRPKEPVLLLNYPYRQPVGWFDWVENKVPMSWGWFWRFRDRFRGPAVLLQAWVVELNTNVIPQRDLGLGEPYQGRTNGAMVWRLGPNDMSSLWSRLKYRSDVEMLSAPSVSTADSIPAQLMSGNTVSVKGAKVDVGLKVDVFPRVKGDNLDLLAGVMSSELLTNSETIRTNLALAARLQLGNKCGVFVVPTNSTGTVYGVILSGSWTQGK